MPIPILSVTASKVSPGAPMTPLDDMTGMVQHALALTKKAHESPNMTHKRTWFGSSSGAPEVAAWTEKMFNYLNGGLMRLSFSCANTAGSIASCAMYQTDRVRGGLETPNKLINMQLNNGFRSGLYSYGEKVGTIIHELTHKCIGTNDEKLGLQDCYGAVLCSEMARTRPDLALTNADNWGYYFTAYHTDLGLAGDDWKYLTEGDMAGVGPRIV